MKTVYIAWIGIVCMLFSCTQQSEQSRFQANTPDVVTVDGYVLPPDSISPPVVKIAGKPTVITAGYPQEVIANANIHPQGKPKIVPATLPFITRPGTDTFLLPEKVLVKDSCFTAGVPETNMAKEAYTRDHNSQNFCSYGKLQGLKHSIVNCILQDNFGNLWIGTAGGGVSKYDGQTFTHYTETEGLSNNNILCMLIDKKGNLWFGTYGGGVSRYDGKYFAHFNSSNGLSDIIPSCSEDKDGNVWFGRQSGGATKCVVKDSGKVEFITYAAKQGFSNKGVRSIIKDNTGNMWFATEGDGVFKFDGTTFFHYTVRQGLLNNRVLKLLQDKNGSIWFGTEDEGACRFDGKTFTNYTTEEGLSSNFISSLIEDSNGNIWLGTYGGGVNKYDGKSFTHYTDNEGLYSNLIFGLLEDKSGNLWIGPYCGGLSKYNGKTFTHYSNKEGLANSSVFAIVEDNSGAVWFGTNGGGISKYDGKAFKSYSTGQGVPHNTIWDALKDKNGDLWFGTNGGGVCKVSGLEKDRPQFTIYDAKQGMPSGIIRSVLEDKSGNLWFGTEGGGVCMFDGKKLTCYTTKEGLSNNAIFCLEEDKDGNIWIGTYGGGVNKFDGKVFTHYTEKQGLANNFVLSMLKDAHGNMWFGTAGGGVDKYDGKYFTHFTEKEGLQNNFVLSILEDKKGNLWFGTRFGLSKLANNYMVRLAKNYANESNEQLILFKNYSYQDGFLGIGCNAKAIAQDKKGTIWIGANDRLTAFHPEGEDVDTIPPNVQLTNIELFDENIPWLTFEKNKDTSMLLGNGVKIAGLTFDKIGEWYNLPQNLSLFHDNNYLVFNYIGITQKQSRKIKYQYKLEGFDDKWSTQTNHTEVPYRNLPHGNYIFKVKAMNSEGFWSKEYTYPFVIRPPWSKTWWFRTLLVIFGLLVLYSIYLWRTAALRQGKKILEKTVEERTAEVLHQKDEAEKQRTLVEKKQKEILDSITYAKRIQEAILPSEEVVKSYLPESFILYKPKDIVAGDFYWVEKMEELHSVIFAAADCTGHGVPGAMVSVICNNALNRVLKEFKLIEPDQILNKTRELVIEQFEKSNDEVKDGMDISICVLNTSTKLLRWAGANNPLWIVRDNKLLETRPDKQPIGKYAENKPFTAHTIQLHKGDVIYIFTDGFADQFGGRKGKKFKIAALRELLLKMHSKPLDQQKQEIDTVFEQWKGDLEQVDDVCIIGVKC
jgi:ligand-binding sensor domain-containing protein/serine phosphatase RsbU (regulator of sigma subunit)